MPVDIYRVPQGDAGTYATLEHMRDMTWRGAHDPEVTRVARSVVGRYPTATQRAMALRDWLHSNVRFVEDPAGYELLISPGEMVQQAQAGHAEGDCDDVAMLAGALGIASGFGGRYRVLAFGGGPYQHVFTELSDRGRGPWFAMDTTRPYQALPVTATRNVVYPI